MKHQLSPWKNQAPKNAETWPEGTLICGDALDFLNSLQDEIADIVFLDPPFNLGKKYGARESKDDLIAEHEYGKFMFDIVTASVRVLKQGGALFLYHVPHWALRLGSFLDQRMSFRHWIAVSMKSGFVRGDYLYPAHYSLLYFTKGEPKYFDRPKIPPPRCRHCGKYIKDYGGYARFVENGVNLSDVWEDLSPVRHANKKNRPANELPLELARRVIHISGEKDGLLVDPFVGSGTTIVAAIEAGMRFVACDRERLSCEATGRRLVEFMGNENQTRKGFSNGGQDEN